MAAKVLFASLPVKDFKTARAWYERFFGRPADVVAHEHEVMWQVTDGAWLYIVLNALQAGTGTVAMTVPDIEAETSALSQRGIRTGPIKDEGDAGRKSIVFDPDGNSIAILEVSDRR
jgi:predicted enzyme related to lactoylglutathione lyase